MKTSLNILMPECLKWRRDLCYGLNFLKHLLNVEMRTDIVEHLSSRKRAWTDASPLVK